MYMHFVVWRPLKVISYIDLVFFYFCCFVLLNCRVVWTVVIHYWPSQGGPWYGSCCLFLVLEFRLCFTFSLLIIHVLLVRFGLRSDHLLGNSCPLGWPFVHIVFCLLVIWFISPFWFWEQDLPSDCSSSCSLLSHYTPYLRVVLYLGLAAWRMLYLSLYSINRQKLSLQLSNFGCCVFKGLPRQIN